MKNVRDFAKDIMQTARLLIEAGVELMPVMFLIYPNDNVEVGSMIGSQENIRDHIALVRRANPKCGIVVIVDTWLSTANPRLDRAEGVMAHYYEPGHDGKAMLQKYERLPGKRIRWMEIQEGTPITIPMPRRAA